MADLLIDGDVHTSHDTNCITGHMVYEVSSTVRYLFYIKGVVARDFYYVKITSGTPGTPVLIHSGLIEAATIRAREWTTGDKTDNDVDIWVGDRAGGAAAGTLSYYRLDDVGGTDSLTSEVEILTNLTWTTSGSVQAKCLAGGITHDGQLLIAYRTDAAGEHGLQRSTAASNGAAWDPQNTPFAANDDMLIFTPGNASELSSAKDCWFIYDDVSANSLLLRVYSDAGDSGAGTYADTTIDADFTTGVNALSMSAVHRFSDGHILVAMWAAVDSATNSDLRVYDITTPASISEPAGADLISGQDDTIECLLFINQQNNQLYLVMIGAAADTLFSTVTINYLGSNNNGATWAAPTITRFDVNTADDHRSVYGGHSVGDNGGLFAPVWFDDDDNDLFTNVVNQVSIAAASVGAASLVIPRQALPMAILGR